MTTIKYADGRPAVHFDLIEEARIYLYDHGCAVVEECGDRWLAWRTHEEAENDDGANAVAEIIES